VLDWLEVRAREFDDDDLRGILRMMALEQADLQEVLADEELAAECNAAVRELGRFLVRRVIPRDEPPDDLTVPSGAMGSLVRAWVRHGISVAVVMRALRNVQMAFWQWWMKDVDARVEDSALRNAVLQHSWVRVSDWQGREWDQVDRMYARERERWMKGAQIRRAELIQLVLAGESVERERADATLGYSLRDVHTAVVLWHDAEDERARRSPPDLEQATRALSRALGGGPALTMELGQRSLWAWIPTNPGRGEPAWSATASVSLPATVRVAAGRPAPGIEGFRSSHQDARMVRRLMAVARHPAQLLSFDEVELACLMSSEPQAMRRLVSRRLGALAGRDPGVARLRETARVYLACASNASEAAHRLGTHRNTVLYRIARAEKLLGRSISESRLELEVALMLAQALGDRVLPADEDPGPEGPARLSKPSSVPEGNGRSTLV
jgi:PucR C-terminal helix-turn-helix domain/GGDEF-like domain